MGPGVGITVGITPRTSGLATGMIPTSILLPPPVGYVYVVDGNGAYIIDNNGSYVVTPE